jgi:GTP cyclohydrolase I
MPDEHPLETLQNGVLRSGVPSIAVRDNSKQSADRDDDMHLLSSHYKAILSGLGEDPTRQGLLRTPDRAAKAMLYFTKGYKENIAGRHFYINVTVLIYSMFN